MNRIGNLAYDDEKYKYHSARQNMEQKRTQTGIGSTTSKNNPNEYKKRKTNKNSENSERVLNRKSSKNIVQKNRKKSVSSKRMSKISFELIAAIVIIAVSAGVMISSYVRVNEGRSEITELEENLKNEEAKTSQKSFELEQSIDLTEIEKEATTRLEMQRPEKYQKIYINVPADDVTHTTSDSVEGIGNRIKSFFGKIGSAIIEFFSIK